MRTARIVALLIAVVTAKRVLAETDHRSISKPQPRAICIAHSEDGVHFTPTGETLVVGGQRPDLVQLPDGDLLTVFEYNPPDEKDTPRKVEIWATRSKDNGRSWLRARPIALRGIEKDDGICNPDLVVTPSGLVRAYFCVSQAKERTRSRVEALIGSAVTRDGIEFQVDRHTRFVCKDMETARATAMRADRQSVMLVSADARDDRGQKKSPTVVLQYVSADGRAFSAPERARVAGEVGHVLRLDAHHFRMFVNAGNDIRSRMSNDAVRWRDEAEVCLRGGNDAAVAKLENGKYLMLFCAPVDAKNAAAPLASAPAPDEAPKKSDTADGSEHRQAANSSSEELPGQANPAADPKANSAADDEGWDAFVSGGYESELGTEWLNRSGGAANPDGMGDGDDLAPVPDLKNKVDYVGWFIQNGIVPEDQNAYAGYVPVLEGIPAREELINDMFNDPEDGLKPGPWNPANRPLWEESYQATQDLMAQYYQAARDPRPYSCPLDFGEDTDLTSALLLEFRLPALRDMRAASKAVLSQAWRAPDGTVSPDQMRDAFGTALGNANHLAGGCTLIERLVGNAQRNLARTNAMYALQRNVFNSADELEATLNVLRESDAPDPNPGGWVRFEHAASMDIIQFMFQPKTPGGEPELRQDNLEKLGMLVWPQPELTEEEVQKVFQLTPAQARANAELMTEHYRAFEAYYRTQFPYQSADHLELPEAEREEHPIAKHLLPPVGRITERLRQNETSRRATQLAYSVELFRARNGRYPSSLAELPAEQVADVRTDPYSGQDFQYRVTESGPRIYTVSRNGQDDGGVHAQKWGEDQAGGSDDFVFYPPQE